MPKMKTRRSAAKRFKVTGTGEFKRGREICAKQVSFTRPIMNM